MRKILNLVQKVYEIGLYPLSISLIVDSKVPELMTQRPVPEDYNIYLGLLEMAIGVYVGVSHHNKIMEKYYK